MELPSRNRQGWFDLSRHVRREIRRRELCSVLVRPFRAVLASALRVLVLVVVLVVIFKVSFVEAFFVPSSSMTPTLRARDYILVPKFLYGLRLPLFKDVVVSWARPERGDVIVFNRAHPSVDGVSSETENVVKRVIGLENDVVEILGRAVLVNGAPLQEPYVTWSGGAGEAPYHFGPQKVPAGKVFVLGDNRDNSEDSRVWADPFVSLSQVLGKAVMVYWSSAQDSRVRTVL